LIILTGFGPFGKYRTNLSSEIVNELPYEIEGFTIIKQIIPVSWRESIYSYKDLYSNLKSNPKLVVLLGIHTKKNIHLENYGWNFRFGDDIDKKIKFGPIRAYLKPWFKTQLNLERIYSNLEDQSNISISYFPGFYLCNYLYYWALYLSKKKYPVIFIHIPYKGKESIYVQKVEMIIKSIIKTHFK
jgi:pyroglutamyl-peptidase